MINQKKMEKTRYEQRIESGELTPMNALDWVLLETLVDNIIKFNRCTSEEKEFLSEFTDEIGYLYREEPETIVKLNEILKHVNPKD